jgi:hypothetical protein
MSWVVQQLGIGGGSSVGPSLAVFQDRLFAAWKGGGDDQRMFWSSFVAPEILLTDESNQIRVSGSDFTPDDKATILYRFDDPVGDGPITTSSGGPEFVSTDSFGKFVFVVSLLSALHPKNILVKATDSKSSRSASAHLR